jgi:hypothetical protein
LQCFSLEAWILLAVSLVDLATTVWLLNHGRAVEANPLLNYYLDAGLEWFLVFKGVILCLIPVGLVEWMRQRSPQYDRTLRMVLRCGIAGYAALYVVMVARANW